MAKTEFAGAVISLCRPQNSEIRDRNLDVTNRPTNRRTWRLMIKNFFSSADCIDLNNRVSKTIEKGLLLLSFLTVNEENKFDYTDKNVGIC